MGAGGGVSGGAALRCATTCCCRGCRCRQPGGFERLPHSAPQRCCCFPHSTPLQTAARCSLPAALQGHGAGLRDRARFLMALVLASGVVGLVQFSLTTRLRLPLHVAVQAAVLLLVTMKDISTVCASEVMALLPSQALVHRLYSAIDFMSLRGVLYGDANGGGGGKSADGSAGAGAPTPAAECWAVLALLQVALGFVLPTVILANWECGELQWYSKRPGMASRRFQHDWLTALYSHATDMPGDAGWLRRAKLAFAAAILLSVLWDILALMAIQSGG